MHILLVADGRSPIARRWLDGLLALDYRVTLVSSHPCQPPPGIEAMHVLPIAFSRFSTSQKSGQVKAKSSSRGLVKSFRSTFLAARYLLGPASVRYYATRFRTLVEQIKPDMVHALRIPYEGMLASYTPPNLPLVVSTWGNDLTLHASHSRGMAAFTRKTLERADGLHTDTERDMRLAGQWGFSPDRPGLVAPGNGGIDLEQVQRKRQPLPVEYEALIPKDHNLIINPRGLRSYTRTDTFFQSIPLILEKAPNTAILCPSMAGEAEAERWTAAIQADWRVVLLPSLSQGVLWELFTRCPISISITNHDGTPNTLLEAMSLGSFPIAGDIESLREWIVPGENGLLVDPGSPSALANAVVQALNDPKLRARASRQNLDIVRERAEVAHIRPKIAAFYQSVTGMG